VPGITGRPGMLEMPGMSGIPGINEIPGTFGMWECLECQECNVRKF